MRQSRVLCALLLALVLALVSSTVSATAAARQPVEIQVLNVSDWHGQLDPIAVTNVGNVGGAAVLAAYFKQHRAENPNALTLTSGDAVGATSPISSFFQDEPTIRAMRLMGFDADTLGNHNFDAGIGRLQSQIDLAGDTTGAVPGKPFTYLSADLRIMDQVLAGYVSTSSPLIPTIQGRIECTRSGAAVCPAITAP
jgi:2',3'-cyclic-nucleotide 2'-phosphodiesterase (5'-nucleotidase family)